MQRPVNAQVSAVPNFDASLQAAHAFMQEQDPSSAEVVLLSLKHYRQLTYVAHQ